MRLTQAQAHGNETQSGQNQARLHKVQEEGKDVVKAEEEATSLDEATVPPALTTVVENKISRLREKIW
jgi:hypothetical protein